MAYLVNITARAERDFASLYREINAEESDAALKWYRGLKEAVLSLEELPNRCPVTPEKRDSAISSTAASLTSIVSYFVLLRNRSGLTCSIFATAQETN